MFQTFISQIKTAFSVLFSDLKQRFVNIETLVATYRIPLYGFALWQMGPNVLPVEPFITFDPHQFGWVILALALDRASTPVIDFLIDPVKWQAKREIAVERRKAEMQGGQDVDPVAAE
ncbi:hypothetical protein JL101_035955 (plasmid) [Skermanella rosea]|uniref:hypothetical protein n=1 Tax=Skermanella rosea TaxID=1817965 RepID=UPI001931763E|nr:hypothetical protein [Skermanella rosea]UEM08048.1 hypothetical protein JL101_035955 [Skermanella rosea]